MSPVEPPAGEQEPREPTWSEKVLKIHEALERRGIPYAFGGAIALNYHREPRATIDIDVNIFLDPEDEAGTIGALSELHPIEGRDQLIASLRRDGQARTAWGITHVDLFFANTEFHDAMGQRVARQPFDGAEIPVISIEDLVVAKVLYARPKDWLDIEAVVTTEREKLDRGYIRHWVDQFLDSDDSRVARLKAALAN